MKKTIFLTALALGSTLAYGIDYTTTTTGTGQGIGSYYGWCAKLTDSFMQTDPSGLSGLLTLNSITLHAGGGSGGSLDSGSKLAVFSYVGDAMVGEFVGLSSNSVTRSAGSDMVYRFSNVSLDVDKRYQFLFVAADTSVDHFNNLSDGATTFTAYQSVSGSVRHNVQNHASLPSGDGTYKTNSLNNWETFYVSEAVYGLSSSEVVPEPATATLSLLALAGLAARRRRK